MDIQTAKDIFSNAGNQITAQNDIKGTNEYMSKGHYNMTTSEFIDACRPHEGLTISEANQLLGQFCVPLGDKNIENNLYWHYYPHKLD